MKSFFRDVQEHVIAPLPIFLILFIITLLTFAGPFGTSLNMTYWERLQYWGSVVPLAVISVYFVKVLVDRMVPGLTFWKNGALVSFGFTILYTPMLATIANLMTADKRENITPIWLMGVIVFSVSMAIVQTRYLWGADEWSEPQERPRLFARFSEPGISDVLYMTVRDHYVDVTTDKGMETLLMRFSDAIAELDTVDGMRVHRSHWVATSAVVRLERANGRAIAIMRDGNRIPVSRAYREDVETRLG